MDSPWKGLARKSGTCLHFYLLHVLGALYPLAEILNYQKTEANSFSFILIVAKAVLATPSGAHCL